MVILLSQCGQCAVSWVGGVPLRVIFMLLCLGSICRGQGTIVMDHRRPNEPINIIQPTSLSVFIFKGKLLVVLCEVGGLVFYVVFCGVVGYFAWSVLLKRCCVG